MIYFINSSLSQKNISLGAFDLILKDTRNVLEFQRLLQTAITPHEEKLDVDEEPTPSLGLTLTHISDPIPVPTLTTALPGFNRVATSNRFAKPEIFVPDFTKKITDASDECYYALGVFAEPDRIQKHKLDDAFMTLLIRYIAQRAQCTRKVAKALILTESDGHTSPGFNRFTAYGLLQLRLDLHYKNCVDANSESIADFMRAIGYDITAQEIIQLTRAELYNELVSIHCAVEYLATHCVATTPSGLRARQTAGHIYIRYSSGRTNYDPDTVMSTKQPRSIYEHLLRFYEKYDAL